MLRRAVRFAILLAIAWCVMTFTHEAGHILVGWACGGRLVHAELAPWQLPHSHIDPDPRPLVTLWGGPILGILIPLSLASLLRYSVAGFVATFCLLANGSYLALAWITGDRHLDTARLLEHGSSPVLIGLYCLLTIDPGYIGFRRHCARLLTVRQ